MAYSLPKPEGGGGALYGMVSYGKLAELTKENCKREKEERAVGNNLSDGANNKKIGYNGASPWAYNNRVPGFREKVASVTREKDLVTACRVLLQQPEKYPFFLTPNSTILCLQRVLRLGCAIIMATFAILRCSVEETWADVLSGVPCFFSGITNFSDCLRRSAALLTSSRRRHSGYVSDGSLVNLRLVNPIRYPSTALGVYQNKTRTSKNK
ncbi:hypothetical protein KQX54_016071 [Cotesia glomerata]|uniref:Uncharacterized protein n=1 Tax=Cotesia glomerata TaxID=32391 RepID=A0AAV7HW30_COTGL|nr:hypothetical protein KQX54_016071 [Cotesia glomerata]